MARGKQNFLMAAAGCAVGAVNGIFGGGGGMLVVPLLTAAGGKPPLVAHATAILIIAPICLASAATYAIAGYFSAQVVIPAAIGMSAGGAAGAVLLKSLPLLAVKIIFVAAMLAAGIRMVLP